MGDDLSQLTNEQLLQMAGIAPSGPAPSPSGPRQIVGPAPEKPEGPPSGYRYNAQGGLSLSPAVPPIQTLKSQPRQSLS